MQRKDPKPDSDCTLNRRPFAIQAQGSDQAAAGAQLELLQAFLAGITAVAPSLDARLFIAPFLPRISNGSAQPPLLEYSLAASYVDSSEPSDATTFSRAVAELYRVVTADNLQQLAKLVASLPGSSLPGDASPTVPAFSSPTFSASTVFLAFFCKELECASSGRGLIIKSALESCWEPVRDAMQQLNPADLHSALQWVLQEGPNPTHSFPQAASNEDELPESSLKLTLSARQALLGDAIAALTASVGEGDSLNQIHQSLSTFKEFKQSLASSKVK